MKSLNEFKEEVRRVFEKKGNDPIKNLKFVRWGGINPVKQKGYNVKLDDFHSFHSPPARKGMFAFPWPFVEYFLLGVNEFNPNRHEWVKRPDGSLINDKDPDAEEWEKRTKGRIGFTRMPEKGKHKSLTDERLIIRQQYQDGKIDKNEYDKRVKEIEDDVQKRVNKGWFMIKVKPPKFFKHEGDIWHHLKLHTKPSEIKDEHGAWIKTDIETYKRLLRKELGSMKKQKEREGIGVSKDHLEVFIERIKRNVKEKWERPLALGYSNEAEGAEEAEDNLNNDGEEVPGDTEFPTYDQLKVIKSKMSKHDLSFTVPYDDFRRRTTGEK